MSLTPLPHREKVALRPVAPVERTGETAAEAKVTLWYDTRALAEDPAARSVFERIARGHLRYTGALLYPDAAEELLPLISGRLDIVLEARSPGDWERILAHLTDSARLIVASEDEDLLAEARRAELSTCLRVYVDDANSLHTAIERGSRHDFVMIRFRDPTNIPLELVIATLQPTETQLVKEIVDPDDVDDAVVALGVMEVGADGVMYSPRTQAKLDALSARLAVAECPEVQLEVGTVLRSEPVGMGFRSCVDLATLFEPTEGMIVGSTSQGGILCCPEVFYLPYMELRPFRVNAGAVHSYVYNFGDRTDYMTELRAGAPVMVVGSDGRARRAVVGRVKTEMRPLRLIEVQFKSGATVNVLMQDDWHVRVFSADAKPLNITELKPGDQVLGHVANPGRHVGIKVDEHIVEE